MTTVTSPTDLLATVPFLIGYQPSDSIVLMALTDESISMAMRIDFPDSLTKSEAAGLAARIASERADAVLMVSYIPDLFDGAEQVLEVLSAALLAHELLLRESIIVVAGRWRSLVCADSSCCPIEGSPLPELTESRVAVEEIANGKPLPFPDLATMAESIASFPNDLALIEMISRIESIDYAGDALPSQREGAAAVTDFIHDFATDGICRDRRLVATLLVRLQDLQVRDYALGVMNDAERELHYVAWRWLLRRAPEGYVAAPATLFAVACYERGDGALANLALERARADQPNYTLTNLLSQVFRSGQPPALFRELRAELHPKVCATLFSGSMNS
jgi:hypothetical protein